MQELSGVSQVMRPTSIEQLKSYVDGNIVQLPDFAEGQPFYAKLRRPSLMRMVTNGTIPNELLIKTNELFVDRVATSKNISDDGMLEELYKIFDIVCDATFVEPTYKEIKDAGVELTDDQFMFIFSYCQTGVRALESFRAEQKG